MKTIINILLALTVATAHAGLPPTTSQVQSETTPTTTFFYNFPRLTGTHSGVSTTFGGEIDSTGLVAGGILSINANPALFDLATSTVDFFDYTVSATNPTVSQKVCGPFTAQTVTNLATADSTYILLNSSCAIIQQTTFPTPAQRRAFAFIGRLFHGNHTSITTAATLPDYLVDTNSQVYDYFDAMGAFNVSGNEITGIAASLGFAKTAGVVWRRSANYANSNQNPHQTTTAAASPVTFVKATRTAINPVAVTALDVTNYNPTGDTVSAVPGGGGTSTNHRIYLFSNGAVGVQYGQNTFANLAAAVSGISTSTFQINNTATDGGILLGIYSCRKDATDITNTAQCVFTRTGRFDQTGSTSAGGISTTTLQQAYNNSSQPQITVSSSLLGIQVRDASVPIGSSLFAVQNNANTINYLGVDVNGITTTNFVGTGTAGAVRVHNLTTAQKNALTPANGMIVYDTTLNRMECYVNGSWDGCTRPVLSVQTPTGGSSLTLDLTIPVQRIRLTPASAVSLSATVPLGSSAPIDGAMIILVGTSDTNTVTFTASDTAKGIFDYGVTLGRGDIVTLIYSATDDRYYIKSMGH